MAIAEHPAAGWRTCPLGKPLQVGPHEFEHVAYNVTADVLRLVRSHDIVAALEEDRAWSPILDPADRPTTIDVIEWKRARDALRDEGGLFVELPGCERVRVPEAEELVRESCRLPDRLFE